MPMMPAGMPPEDMQAYLDEQQRLAEHERKIQHWYDVQMARIEVETRRQTLRFAAILCRCLQHEPCPVHSNVMVTRDGSEVL